MVGRPLSLALPLTGLIWSQRRPVCSTYQRAPRSPITSFSGTWGVPGSLYMFMPDILNILVTGAWHLHGMVVPCCLIGFF